MKITTFGLCIIGFIAYPVLYGMRCFDLEPIPEVDENVDENKAEDHVRAQKKYAHSCSIHYQEAYWFYPEVWEVVFYDENDNEIARYFSDCDEDTDEQGRFNLSVIEGEETKYFLFDMHKPKRMCKGFPLDLTKINLVIKVNPHRAPIGWHCTIL